MAGHLASTRGRGKASEQILFLFDEPTTGLHFDDIATLLGAFRKLIGAGHSIVVIEHNLEVVNAADWIIDLGPEGGDAGGRVICEGILDQVLACEESHTGKALVERGRKLHAARGETGPGLYEFVHARQFRSGNNRAVAAKKSPYTGYSKQSIMIRHAREHNLQSIDVSGSAPISGIAERLCPAVCPALVPPGRGQCFWRSAHYCHRAAVEPWWKKEHCCDHD